MNQSDLHFFQDEKGREDMLLRIRKKGGDQQYLPVPDDTRWALRAYLGHPELKTIDRKLEHGDQVLFVSTNWRGVPPHEYHGEARRIHRRTILGIVRQHGKKAGLPKEMLHPHSMRHMFATELVEADVNMLLVQALMGHARPETTAIYTNVAMRKLSKVVKEANPLARIKTPLSGLSSALRNAPR